MSFKALAWAWAAVREHAELRPTARLVLLCLADRMNSHRHHCYPSIASICEDTGLDKNTVVKAVKSLVEAGLITQTKRFQKTTIYEMAVDLKTYSIPKMQNSEKAEKWENKNSAFPPASILKNPPPEFRKSRKKPGSIKPGSKSTSPKACSALETLTDRSWAKGIEMAPGEMAIDD